MKHDDLPMVAALAFVSNLTFGSLTLAWGIPLHYNVFEMLAILIGASTLVSMSIALYYACTGGLPIRKRNIEEALGKLKE